MDLGRRVYPSLGLLGALAWKIAGKLQSLGLHENSLGGALPSELGKLGSLQYLWLHNNQFNGSLPSEVGQLSELRFLWFANNSVVSLPRHIGRLQRLRSLDGSHNELSVRLPFLRALLVLRRSGPRCFGVREQHIRVKDRSSAAASA